MDRQTIIRRIIDKLVLWIDHKLKRLWARLTTAGGWLTLFLVVCYLSYVIFFQKKFSLPLAASWLFTLLMWISATVAMVKRFFQQDARVTGPQTIGEKVIESFEQQYNSFIRKYGKNELYERSLILVFGEERGGKSNIINSSPIVYNKAKEIKKTEGCYWVISEQEIILDTPGELMRPESGWEQFLEQLKETRPRYPINSILLVIPIYRLCDPFFEFQENANPILYSAENLQPYKGGDFEIKVYSELFDDLEDEKRRQELIKEKSKITEYADLIVQRLKSIAQIVQFQIPVYVVFSKCDLLYGFRDFIRMHSPEKEMLGLRQFEEFELEFINDLQVWQLKDARNEDIIRSSFRFLENLRVLKQRIEIYHEAFKELFSDNEGTGKISLFQFRGYYFSSCKQFARVDAEKATWKAESKAFFIHDLFEKKLRKESGLAKAYPSKSRSVQNAVKAITLVGWCLVIVLFALGLLYYRSSHEKFEELKNNSRHLVELDFKNYADIHQMAQFDKDAMEKVTLFHKNCQKFSGKGVDRFLLIAMWRSETLEVKGKKLAATIFFKRIFRNIMELTLHKIGKELDNATREPVLSNTDKEKYLGNIIHKIAGAHQKYLAYQKAKEIKNIAAFKELYAWVLGEQVQEDVSVFFVVDYRGMLSEVSAELAKTEESQIVEAKTMIKKRLETIFSKGFFPNCQNFWEIYANIKKAHDTLIAKCNTAGSVLEMEDFDILCQEVGKWQAQLGELKISRNEYDKLYDKLLELDFARTRENLEVLQENSLLTFAEIWEIYKKYGADPEVVRQLKRFTLQVAQGGRELTFNELSEQLHYLTLKYNLLQLVQKNQDLAQLAISHDVIAKRLAELQDVSKLIDKKNIDQIEYLLDFQKIWNRAIPHFCKNILYEIVEKRLKPRVQSLHRNVLYLGNTRELDVYVEDTYVKELAKITETPFVALLDQFARTVKTLESQDRKRLDELLTLKEKELQKLGEFIKDNDFKEFIDLNNEELSKIVPEQISNKALSRLLDWTPRFYITEPGLDIASWIKNDAKAQARRIYAPFEIRLLEYWQARSEQWLNENKATLFAEFFQEKGNLYYLSFRDETKKTQQIDKAKFREKLDTFQKLYEDLTEKIWLRMAQLIDCSKITKKNKELFIKTAIDSMEVYVRVLKAIYDNFQNIKNIDKIERLKDDIEIYRKSSEGVCEHLDRWYQRLILPWLALKEEIAELKDQMLPEETLNKIVALHKEFEGFRKYVKDQEDHFFKQAMVKWQAAVEKDLQGWKVKTTEFIEGRIREPLVEIQDKFPFTRQSPDEALPEFIDEYFKVCTQFLKYRTFIDKNRSFDIYDKWLELLYATKKKTEFNVKETQFKVKLEFPPNNEYVLYLNIGDAQWRAGATGKDDRHEFNWKLGQPLALEVHHVASPKIIFFCKPTLQQQKLLLRGDDDKLTIFKVPKGTTWALFRFIDQYAEPIIQSRLQFAFKYNVGAGGMVKSLEVEIEIHPGKKYSFPWTQE